MTPLVHFDVLSPLPGCQSGKDLVRAVLRNLFHGTTIDAHPTDAL